MNKVAMIAAFLLLLSAGQKTDAAERPVVVELFTSEGCSSCPPADALLAELAKQPGVFALSFHVDYWDRLGWKDPFSSAAATARQRSYARLLGTDGIYTPQIVVDGARQAVGSDRGAVLKAIAAARQAPPPYPVTLTVDRGRARVTIGAVAGATGGSIVLVGFDQRHVDAVKGGENDGRTLTHVDVVRGIAEIGKFDAKGATIEAPVTWHADRLAVLATAENGHILAAAIADAAGM